MVVQRNSKIVRLGAEFCKGAKSMNSGMVQISQSCGNYKFRKGVKTMKFRKGVESTNAAKVRKLRNSAEARKVQIPENYEILEF
jgi:hypothetical protein